jgi:hypothetical protein
MSGVWRRSLCVMVVGLALLGSASTLSASEAQAAPVANRTVRVWDCHRDAGADLFKTWSTTGNTCWEGLGRVQVKLYKVNTVWSGRFTGYYRTSDKKKHSFKPWKNYYPKNATITEIVLTSQV